MTTEEKARRYDEALEKAEKIHNEHKAQPFNVMLKVFPELKESEDERKELIEFVKSRGGFKQEYIAWLEKQGEHANFRNKIQIGDKVTRNKDGVIVNLSQLNRVAKKDEKQGEQKPYGQREECSDCQFNYAGECKGYCAMKRGEQKPAENVEPRFKVGDKIYLKPEYRMPDDDTPIANTVFEIRAIDDKHYRFDRSYIFIEDQDKYELVEQESSWSKENEKMIGNIRRIIAQYAFSQSAVDVNGDLCEKEYIDADNWLKSLRYQSQWKPSDEQMKALDSAIHCYAGISPTNNREVYALEIMKEQLKKLMEE